MSLPLNTSNLALKRKLQEADNRSVKRHLSQGYDPQTPWLHETKALPGWQNLSHPVHESMPLANMVSAVQDLIDPDFDPLIAILDEEPRFLKPLPTRVCPEDLEFLRFRGALSIPETGLRNELLRSYIQWVHSFMPVLNLQELLRCVAENDSAGNVSIVLFQAIMFVGTAFVDLKYLQAAGFSTRKSARNAFYTRLRLLYSLDCEEDRIVILQTLLLMTYWSDVEGSPQRDIWDWMGICNTQAHSIGLNKDPSAIESIDPRDRRLRIRLWWCLYSRDRLIAMGMRRPMQVNDGTSSVPMLKFDDFDFEPFSKSAVALFRCPQLEDFSHQKRLVAMFIEKAKLCQCIGRVLFAQYTPSQRQFGATDCTTVTLVPRQASESEFSRCRQKVDQWLTSLPKDAQFVPGAQRNFRDGEGVLILHGALLRMLYYATSSALHRPWTAHKTARTRMEEAAAGISEILQSLNQLSLTRFLPQSGVTVILPAAVAHLSNSMSDNAAIRESSINNLQRCIRVLHSLKDIYPAANVEFANLEAAIKHQSNNYNSNTFFQIMQYDFGSPLTQLDYSKPGNADANSTQSPRNLQNKYISTEATTPLSQVRAASAHEQHNLSSRKFNTETPKEPSEQTTLSSNPFSHEFDDQFEDRFAIQPSTNLNSNNPFNFLSVDFDFIESSPSGTEPSSVASVATIPAITPQPDEGNSIDWAQALFRGNSLPTLDKPEFDELHHRSVSLDHHFHHKEEHDLFSFAIGDDEGNGLGPRHNSISQFSGPITGDLDRDLGFQTGDDGF
ncbi:hypothetical protein N7495_007287 [Penicillium taxi]|uniref:uncharacterized protein n=1 Tax=Penicillium taxi TaxID=168475 RepID=UPI00254532FD|nr:uncharacterized protein N7495_007287 [Penicillium taxi]KAJ5895596.1 hypothetical protein N7495_007287 [Penicillium taxi]